MEHYLTGIPRSFPSNLYPDIESLAEAALRKFSLRNLSSAAQLGAAAMMRPVEAAYQDEMYRALLVVLGFSSEVSSEWSEDGKGRIPRFQDCRRRLGHRNDEGG